MLLSVLSVSLTLQATTYATIAYGGAVKTGLSAFGIREAAPKPTTAPCVNVHARNQIAGRGYINTCGIVSDQPVN
jgi:hypothetical protein